MINYLSQIPPIDEWGADTWKLNPQWSEYPFDIKELQFELTLTVGRHAMIHYSVPVYSPLITDFKTVTFHISSWSSGLYRKLYIFSWYDRIIFDKITNNIEPSEINTILNDINKFVKNKAFL